MLTPTIVLMFSYMKLGVRIRKVNKLAFEVLAHPAYVNDKELAIHSETKTSWIQISKCFRNSNSVDETEKNTLFHTQNKVKNGYCL